MNEQIFCFGLLLFLLNHNALRFSLHLAESISVTNEAHGSSSVIFLFSLDDRCGNELCSACLDSSKNFYTPALLRLSMQRQ